MIVVYFLIFTFNSFDLMGFINRTLKYIFFEASLRAYIRWAWSTLNSAPHPSQSFLILIMQYEHMRSHYTSTSLPSNRNTVLCWKASQHALKQPLRFLDPALCVLYLSAMELQTRSSNIIACNPCKREAEEIP